MKLLFILLLFINANPIKTDEKKDEEPFVPSKEWQVVKKGQQLPQGLHIRVNFETGITEAKILDEEDNNDSSNAIVPVSEKSDENFKQDVIEEDLEKLLKNIKSDESKTISKEKFRSYDEIIKELGDLNVVPKNDAEHLADLVNKFRNKEKENNEESEEEEELLFILEDLEYLVHQYDNALEFMRLNGYKEIIYKSLNNSDVDIKATSLKLFGSSLQNNAKIQIHALETGGLDILLRILALESSSEVKHKAIFALGALLRKFPLAQLKFIQSAGLTVLIKIFESVDVKLHLKTVTLLNDLLNEHFEAVEDKENVDFEEKVRQYNQVGLEHKLVELNYCLYLGDLLKNLYAIDSEDLDPIEKCINAIFTMAEVCGGEFDRKVQIVLKNLSKSFKSNYVADKSDDYFRILHEMVESILKFIYMKNKIEL